MPPPTVEVVYKKFDGRRHWHFHLGFLGEDEHGVWLAGPRGTVLQRGDEPARLEVGGFVAVVPRARPWTAFWNIEEEPEVYVDVTSEPVWSDGDRAVTMIDLDLDVVRQRNGRVVILDEDEFAEHQVRYGYPPAVIEGAAATAAQMIGSLTDRAAPFDDHWRRWLAAARAHFPT